MDRVLDLPESEWAFAGYGRDAKGRKQSRYHPRWREVRDETKYERMMLFGEALPVIRERVEHDLGRPGLPREQVLATIVRLMETTFIRVGNAEYARENHSYGLTTMREKHVDVDGSTVKFDFQGKSGVRHTVDVNDRRLARIIKRCLDLPGYELFQYLDGDGEHHTIDSAEVNDYLREITNENFTAKDFRTWAGTVLAFDFSRNLRPSSRKLRARKMWCRRSPRSPSVSATLLRFSANATSTRPCSSGT